MKHKTIRQFKLIGQNKVIKEVVTYIELNLFRL